MPSVNETLALFGISAEIGSRGNASLTLKGFNESYKMSKALFTKLLFATVNNEIHEVKVPQYSFGIEFEFVGTKQSNNRFMFEYEMNQLLGVGHYFTVDQYHRNSGDYWVLGRDNSIKYNESDVPDPVGYELSTPILELGNKEHFHILHEVLLLVKKWLLAEVNKSCGTHIHFGLNPGSLYMKDIRMILSTYSELEALTFNPIVPSSRRKNRFCKQTTPSVRSKYQKVSARYCKFDENYKCINFHLEFRQLEGTLDYNLIYNWITLHSVILTDLLNHSRIEDYLATLGNKNTFEILFYYNFDTELISYFIKRILDFKSRIIQQS